MLYNPELNNYVYCYIIYIITNFYYKLQGKILKNTVGID